MESLTINGVVRQFGTTSKTLRYYERIGLLSAARSENNYRRYTPADVERIKQILVLRKMQIPVKDIVRIFKDADMATVVEVFVSRINAIENEIESLSELKQITSDFLQAMLKGGVKKISALPILYEQMEKQFIGLKNNGINNFENLDSLAERLAKPVEPSILPLPTMRVISSVKKDGTSDPDGFINWTKLNGMPQGEPGLHERFEYQTDNKNVIFLKVPENFVNCGEFTDYIFPGGLFAAASVYMDEDLNERLRAVIHAFDGSKFFQIDYAADGGLRHAAMLENLISRDGRRELASLLVPVKKRMADASIFSKPIEIFETADEIESANPILWQTDVPLKSLTQTLPRYSNFIINEKGEAEFVAWVLRAVLLTHISVKPPFRVDMEFKQEGGKTGVFFYFGEDTGYSGKIGSRGFGVNMENSNEMQLQAIRFHQPIFWDGYYYPHRGAIKKDAYNRVTWIIGESRLAVIINGEVRYCGANFPYMSQDLSREEACPIVVGASGSEKIIFRSIKISQLAETQKNRIKKGELTMTAKQSNNIIPIIHRLVTDEYGENYWFNGCVKYVMESLGENDFDYWFFAGATGDLFTQHYSFNGYAGDAVSSYMMEEDMGGDPHKFTEEIFSICGYAATYVSNEDILKNTAMYLGALVSYIDRGIPVIAWGTPLVGVIVGYEDYGKTLQYITGNNNMPERIEAEKILTGEKERMPGVFVKQFGGWIFVGNKKESVDLPKIYRNAIFNIPRLARIKTKSHCFGSEAFYAWASDIENGKFDQMTAETFDTWTHYTNYICVLATNGSCCHGFLKRARELNPDMVYIDEISNLFGKIKEAWSELEGLGGGFNVTLETLHNKEKSGKIAAVIRKCGEYAATIVRIVASGKD
ncbi:MAG: MerR family transcriptional regulator [Defluviitaleaceae bacterium]|nr:MerR family transcriptional regulator [Defluviitaleaceae bacterium]